MVYASDNSCLHFDSKTEEGAVAEAVEKISAIHPEIKESFETGVIQSWGNDPSAQGAFFLFRPEPVRFFSTLINWFTSVEIQSHIANSGFKVQSYQAYEQLIKYLYRMNLN